MGGNMARPKLLTEKNLIIVQGEVDAILEEVSEDILRKTFISRNCFANKVTKQLSSGVLKKIFKIHNNELVTRCVYSEISQNLVIFFRLTAERLKRGDKIPESQFRDDVVKVILYSDKIIADISSEIVTYCDFQEWYISFEDSIKLAELFIFEHEKHFSFVKGQVVCEVSDKKFADWICENIKITQPV